MRRSFSILFALLFSLMPAAPALISNPDAGLPACCRRNGAHHCAMSDMEIARLVALLDKSPQFSAPAHCPYYPQHVRATLQQNLAITPKAAYAASFPTVLPIADTYVSVAATGVRLLPSGRAPPSMHTA